MLIAYFGPETTLPVVSALAAVAGFVLMMGRVSKGWILKWFRPRARK